MRKMQGSTKIISMRVSKREYEYLKKIKNNTDKTISDIMREAMLAIALQCEDERKELHSNSN